jgi:CubicO group peptidase (beta-lactamase class C family)
MASIVLASTWRDRHTGNTAMIRLLASWSLIGALSAPACAGEAPEPPAPAVAQGGAAPGGDAHVTEAFAPVRARIQGWLDRGYYTGASLIVVQDGRTLVELRCGNHAETTVEYLASAGKWLAAATIMALVDQGKLSLDDPASRWLGGFDAVKGGATLRQMLAHTSGYPAYQPSGQPRDDYQTLAESVAHLAPLPPDSAPGTHWNYGGLAMQAAGRMAELASGEDWETLFQRTIARPLGMTDTHFTPVDGGLGHSPMLGGGARGSLRDYLRFLAMLAAGGVAPDGRRVLSAAAIAHLQADQVGAAELPPGRFPGTASRPAHHGIYGLGEWRELVDADGRALLVSSPSWAGTYPWLDHRHRLYACLLAHVRGESAGRDHFNPMSASAELPDLVAEAVTWLAADRK